MAAERGSTGAKSEGPTPALRICPARTTDAAAIAAIHDQGIEERQATFEVEPRRPAEVAARIEAGELLLVAERAGEVVGFGSVAQYSRRAAYAGIGECTVYVERSARGRGIGMLLLDALATEAEARGLHKLIGKLFESNAPSVALMRRCGFRTVGVHRRHARLDGEWRDVVLVERSLGEAARA